MKIDEQLLKDFPGLGVKESISSNLKIEGLRPELVSFKKEIEDKIRSSNTLEQIKEQKLVRAYRDFYWKVGIDPTKTRPAGEALARRIIGGKELPTINTFVDSYNLVSAQTFIAIGAFDMGKIHHRSLSMRKARCGEPFQGIGMQKDAKLDGVEIVIEDESDHELVAVYPYRDSEASKVTEDSKNVLLLMCGVPGISDEVLSQTQLLCESYIERFCK